VENTYSIRLQFKEPADYDWPFFVWANSFKEAKQQALTCMRKDNINLPIKEIICFFPVLPGRPYRIIRRSYA
jgi:hypothetical protein